MSLKYSDSTRHISRAVEIVVGAAFWFIDLFRGKPSGVQKIVLIEPFQLGDVISLTVMLDPLKARYPNADIYILTKESNHYALAEDERVRDTLILDFPWTNHGQKKLNLGRLFRLIGSAWALRRHRFDIGIDSRGDIRSQIILKLIGCRQTLGYTSYMHSNITNLGLLLNTRLTECPYRHRYDWNRYLLTGLGIPEKGMFPIQMPTFHVTPVRTRIFREDGPSFKVLIHPGSGWEFKQWPNSNWINLIQQISRNPDVDITIISGPGDQAILDRMRKSLSELEIGYRITDFHQLQNAILESDILICLDSGPMNLAVCMGKDVIGLYGPGDFAKWSPYNPTSKGLHFIDQYPCNPCLQKVCYFPTGNCMTAISVATVFAEFERYFKENYDRSLSYQLK